MPVFGPIGTLSCSASGCTCGGGSGPAVIRFLGCASIPIPGLIVKIWTSSAKTSLVLSGTTDALGQIYGTIPSTRTYWVDASAASGNTQAVWTRFNNLLIGSVILTVGATATFAPNTPASGYACSTVCFAPIKTTLNISDGVYLPGVMTYASGIWSGGTTSLAYPGCGPCGAIVFVGPWLSYTWNGPLNSIWDSPNAPPGPSQYCPGALVIQPFCTYESTSLTCPSVSSNVFNWTCTSGVPVSCNHTGTSNLAYCTAPSFTITE
jgi:hypothetical protein